MNTLAVGDKMPSFSSTDQYGNSISNEDFKGQKIIVFFYPKASTPGCTAEACNLSENYSLLQKMGYDIIGVSADSVKRQGNFSSKYEFPYRLVADEDKQLIKGFGVWGLKKFMGKGFEGIHRKTFIIDENHQITHVIDKVKTKDHTAQIIELIND